MPNEVSTKLTLEETMNEIQRVSDETSISKLHGLPQATRVLRMVAGLRQLRRLFDGEIMANIMEIMDSSLGFRTDRAPGTKDKAGNPVKPYPVPIVRDCVIEAMLRGANLIGNEMNVITGRCYLTKEYYERIVRELVSDLRVKDGVPQLYAGGALVPMRASWVFEGRRDSIDCVKTAEEDLRIPVRVNSGMGADAIMGKAYRKLFAKIHRRVTGSTWLEEETTDVVDSVVATDDQTHAGEALEPQGEDSGEPAVEEVQQGESRQASPLDGIQHVLEGLEQIRDVDTYQQSAAALLDSDEDLARLNEWCEWRREQIRDSRGARSNSTARQEA